MSRINYSLKQENIILAIAIIVTVALFIGISSFILLRNYQQERIQTYVQEGKIVEDNISELFGYVDNYMKFIGQSISHLKTDDLKSIEKIITKKMPKDFWYEGVFSWTLMDFINDKNQLILNSVVGRIEPIVDMSHRSHLNFTNKIGWKLFFSAPVEGNPSREFVMPVGMGIFSNTGKFYGSLVVGLKLNKFAEKIEKLLLESDLSFALVDKQYNLIAKSSALNITKKDFSALVNILEERHSIGGFFTPSFLIENIKLKYLVTLKNYPFYLLLGENRSIIKRDLKRLFLPILLPLIILTLFCIIIIYYLQNRICNPIANLAKVTLKIANNEEAIIPYCRYREINLLADQLSKIKTLTNSLVEAKLEIEVTNLSLEKKVSERTLELEKALEVKTEFLNNMSHEIRTPVQGFMGISEGLDLNWHMYDDLKKHQYMHEIAKNAKRLASLIANLLDLSIFNEGRFLLDLREFDLNQAIEDIIDESRSLYINNRDIKISFERFNGVALVKGDVGRIGQVLRNLFINAIKFSSEESVILTQLFADKIIDDNGDALPAMHFTILDQGVGVPEEELRSIFTSFTQSSRTKNIAGGTGLGLSISEKIIKAHHGHIWAENNIYQDGAIFHFIIPISF